MGKRKSSKKPVTKKSRPKLETSFNCPFCNSASSVTATLDADRGHGGVACGVCGADFGMKIDALAEPVDVYAAWIDACEDANAGDGGD
jgi:transcription elongation factor Elf1